MQPSPRSPRGAGCVVNDSSAGRCPCPDIAELGRGATGIESRLPLCGGGFHTGRISRLQARLRLLCYTYTHSLTHSLTLSARVLLPTANLTQK